MSYRVAITGLGALTPLANDVPALWQALLDGKSGIAPLSFELPEGMPVRFGGQVKDFDPASVLGGKHATRHARFTHLAVGAAQQAARDAGLAEAGHRPEDVGAILGVGFGGLDWVVEQNAVLEARGPSRVSPFGLPALIPNMAAGMVAIELDARGPSYNISSACASSAHAIGEACRLIRAGVCTAVVTGGSEACLTPLALAGFARLGALSTRNADPSAASRPFDRKRDGFVMGEGAAMLVLERLDIARERGAHVYAELAGYGMTSDAFHPTLPREDGDGAVRAMRMALRDAGRAPETVKYINAHGTSTRMNDATELAAIGKLFGANAAHIAVNSTKSMTGHLLGAAGALEALVTALSIERGQLHPSINLDDPEDASFNYVRGQSQSYDVPVALSNSFGFGGHNVSLVLARV